ncbi:MAG: hypothetical protein AB1505_00090 [Candidatus Latescibacterota bacterium]
MSDTVAVDLFAEDHAHQALLGPLILRVAREEAVCVGIRARSARGGHARAIEEYRTYQLLVDKGAVTPAPSLVVVAIDGNCTAFARKREEIRNATGPLLRDRLVVACPDPHVERWYFADPESFHEALGSTPVLGRTKCARAYYKDLLARAVRDGGHPPTLGGIEFARDLVERFSWYRAARNDRSFGAFIADLRDGLRRMRQSLPRSPV